MTADRQLLSLRFYYKDCRCICVITYKVSGCILHRTVKGTDSAEALTWVMRFLNRHRIATLPVPIEERPSTIVLAEVKYYILQEARIKYHLRQQTRNRRKRQAKEKAARTHLRAIRLLSDSN